MKPHRCPSRLLAIALGGASMFGTGCGNLFMPKHKVLVDAISAPDAPKPSGVSYRLVAKRSVVSQTSAQISVVKACIDAALSGQGMFEAPPNAPSDLFIEVAFGQDVAARVDPAARETFLQLSARSNPERSMDRATGPELWDVRVAVLGISGRMETAMPLLSSVAATYVGTNTHMETKVEVPQNSPTIAAVRENALKALDTRNAAPPPPPASTPPPAGPPPSAPPTAATPPPQT
ncbi:MAG: hypothetical protein Q7S40_00815 [Opitutaceae bacterium]|nr:hypothetical protein [Opitutaceae bacterium]